ncbi:MAG: hypothetical protein ACJA16_003442, partial [Akkermansiaceae bacterium]
MGLRANRESPTPHSLGVIFYRSLGDMF